MHETDFDVDQLGGAPPAKGTDVLSVKCHVERGYNLLASMELTQSRIPI